MCNLLEGLTSTQIRETLIGIFPDGIVIGNKAITFEGRSVVITTTTSRKVAWNKFAKSKNVSKCPLKNVVITDNNGAWTITLTKNLSYVWQ